MDLPPPKTRSERDDTDASLLAERAKTDAELARTRVSAEKEAQDVLEVARERAAATLEEERERANRDMAKAGATTAVRKEVATERAAEDRVVAREHAVADREVHAEQDEHRRALAALLHLEREATDEGLLVERARADETVATRDEFLAIVSHDLRNMLGAVALSAGTLLHESTAAGEAGASTRSQAERIQRCTARMNRLVTDLLDLVSLEAGKVQVTPQPREAQKLVRDALEAIGPSFAAKGVGLAMAVPTEAIVASFDHDRMMQVLANLLGNALKFTEPGGRVTVAVEREGAEVLFSVTDTGVGIPADQLATVFERFHQGPMVKQGFGLGLYIARCIVDVHGGRIWADRCDGRGAVIRFTLPEGPAGVSASAD